MSIAIRQKFSQLAVMLGEIDSHRNLPSMDVETRWNSMFTMISECYDRRLVFQSLCKCAEFKERLQKHLITDIEWRVLKSSMHFLSDAHDCTKMASGSSYATISMQPLIFNRLLKLCDATISGTVTTGFTTPVVQKAAAALKSKLLTYEAYMCSENNMIALVLDPRSGNSTVDAQILKNCIRDILRSRYQYASSTNPNDALISDTNVDLFEEETDAATIEEDKVDMFTK
jgi:hypothetical protein